MARTNIPAPAAPLSATRTHEGTIVRNLTPLLELRRTLLSCMLWEDNFYESGTAVVDRLRTLISQVTAAQAAELAVIARTKMKLRHVPLLVAVELSKLKEGRAVLRWLLPLIILRPDELTEFLSLYWGGQGNRQKIKGHGPLANQVKKGLALAFQNFNEYQLAKYNRDNAIKLRDVLFLCHAKPKDDEQSATWGRLVRKELATPDTWETELSAGKDKLTTWVRLIAEEKLGALALLRNLRNMQEAKVPENVIKSALLRMKVDWVLPFRFVAAARYAPTLEPELEQAMFRCVAGLEKLRGKTALVVDTSASMWQDKVSAKSEMTRFDAAAALAILAREQCESVAVYTFNETAHVVPPRRGFALRDAIEATKGGASCGGLAVQMANEAGYDRLIVITDGQWHYSDLERKQRASYQGGSLSYLGWGAQPMQGELGNAIVVSPPPLEKAYMINVAAYQRGVGYGKWTSIDGWSEAIMDYIAESEREGIALS
jgi:60 kDa SS-A/Ro ribonucleoprotein